MATIPIEVILQDAEDPVVPTPEPETDITVPDTGAEFMGSNISFSTSSMISIIVPTMLLILAITTIFVLLVHKHHKKQNKGINASKREKLAAATSGTVAVLSAMALVGNLIVPITRATGDSKTDEGTYLETEDKVSVIAAIDKDSEESIIVNVKDVLYATTDASGYTVTMSMIEDALSSNLYLNGDTESEYYIAPVKDARLGDNTWGYRLDEGNEDYLPVPLADNPATIAEGEETVVHEEINVYYTVKVNNELPFGMYSGKIEYNMEGIYGFPDTLTTMQGMTHEICESVTTPKAFKADGVTIEDDVPTAVLTDIRDNKTYTIAKLADGNCWMTQNLDLQKEDLIVTSLDSTNTDNPAEEFELPDSQTSGNEDWQLGNEYHVYDLNGNGEEYRYCLDIKPWGGCGMYSDEVISTKTFGNYYNWHTVKAGTSAYDPYDGSISVGDGSICPAGWRLPNSYDSGDANEQSGLLYAYGVLDSPAGRGGPYADYQNVDRIFEEPLFYTLAGYYNKGVSKVGIRGHCWFDETRHFEFSDDLVILETGYSVNMFGYSARCLAK